MRVHTAGNRFSFRVAEGYKHEPRYSGKLRPMGWQPSLWARLFTGAKS